MKDNNSESQLDFDNFYPKNPETEIIESGNDIKESKKIKIQRFFTQKNVHPYDEIEWETRSAAITNDKGKVIFQRDDIEVPKPWSQTAINIVASKYFHTYKSTNNVETSVKHLIDRVAKTLASWAKKDGYFESDNDVETYEAELTHLLVNQKAAFNSPVWFNMGVEERPQCSACFINSVTDTMESILDLAKTEGLLFKWGSGTGTNLSPLRSSKEKLSTGGQASGPVSFMKGYDAFAGVIKSGGKTRRAAKMVILNVDHPDINEFINCKVEEEKKAWALIDAGYDGSFGGEAYNSVFFQNSNNSVRVSDEFMRAVADDNNFYTRAVKTKEKIDKFKARDLMKKMCEAAHVCGDPGIQFDSIINDWHTCPESAPINASNPCSEYMFVDNSACNLASLNLMKFIDQNGNFNIEAYRRAIHILIISQEIIVSNSSYPNEKIEGNSHLFRPLGLGYANLGALLMYYGFPYDSDAGRAMAASLTALLTGQSYLTSAILSSSVGTFTEFEKNKSAMMRVMNKHKKAIQNIDSSHVPPKIYEAVKESWNDAIELGERYGYRNAQVTVLAPTGTIGFMMDCDTTGIEPDIALIKYKNMVGGGMVKLVNSTIGPALKRRGYAKNQINDILEYIKKNDTIENAPHLDEKDLEIFDCAFKPAQGKRFIQHMGHIKMMAAVQPFLSGAISKTVNMPNESTPDDIANVYQESWKLGLKSVAIYRDGSKRTQPLMTSKSNETKDEHVIGQRRRLPDERRAMTHKFNIAGHEGYVTVGEYDDGTPGEIFVVMAKEGSVVSGLMDSFATAVSIGLQHGVPLETFINKYTHTRFEPYGFTNNNEIPIAKSISDYIFRWLEKKYLAPKSEPEVDVSDMTEFEKAELDKQSTFINKKENTFQDQDDAPPCHACGSIMVRNGACYKCLNCGETSGCS